MSNNKIDVSKCPHFLPQRGAFKNHEYINNANGCSLRSLGACTYSVCDSKCEWYELQQLKAENEELRNIQLGFCQGEKLFNLYEYSKCLDEIEKICKNSCGMLSPEDCGSFESCQVCKRKSDSETILIILERIKQAKEGKV